MTNSISLSSDLETVFLIEERQVVAFPLLSKNGILIGTLNNQLVAATNTDSISKSGSVESVDVARSQIQFYYSDRFKQAFIIIIDIDASKNPQTSSAPNIQTRALSYNLAIENLIIRRTENKVNLFRVPKKVISNDEKFKPFQS